LLDGPFIKKIIGLLSSCQRQFRELARNTLCDVPETLLENLKLNEPLEVWRGIH